MKFMMLHKTDAYYENGGLPSKELIAGVGKVVGEVELDIRPVAGISTFGK